MPTERQYRRKPRTARSKERKAVEEANGKKLMSASWSLNEEKDVVMTCVDRRWERKERGVLAYSSTNLRRLTPVEDLMLGWCDDSGHFLTLLRF